MKYRLLLVVTLFIPFILKGQTSDVKFYSKGKMYVKYKGSEDGSTSESTTLHIEGSAKFTNGAQIDQKGRTQITGDFINGINSTAASDTLFVNKLAGDGVIAFVGQDKIQSIKSDLSTGFESQKKYNYISFPTIRVEQKWSKEPGFGDMALKPYQEGFVLAESNVAMTVDTLYTAADVLGVQPGQRFRVQSLHDGSGKLNTGHVYIKKLEDKYGEVNAGFSELQMSMYNFDKSVAGEAAYKNKLVQDYREGSKQYFTGFTSPFEKLGADYMLFQVLTKPNAYSITSYEGPVTPPTTVMDAGKGYFMAMDVYKDNYSIIESNPLWPNLHNEDRFIGEYVFSRKLFKDYFASANNPNPDKKRNFNKFSYAKTDGNYIKERFNVGPVTVKLTEGLNFLGNPFMAPISLNPLINWQSNDPSYVVPELGNVTVDREYKTPGTIRDKYWVINHATVENAGDRFLYNVTYDYVSKSQGSSAGITAGGIQPENYLIAPMQMFLLQAASNDVEIQLTPALIRQGNAKTPKSSGPIQSDWFVMEAEAVADNVTDRTTIVFKEGARLDYQQNLDTRKGLTKDIEESAEVAPTTNLLYTKTTDGVAMLGNIVPKTVKEMALYYAPPATAQLVRIRPYGLEQLESVSDVWLIDKYENKKVKLTPETVYEFYAQPIANRDGAVDNRFVLRFYDDSNGGVVEEQEKPINVYYDRFTLHISGLNENDMNSNVQIFDLQGRLVARTTVNNWPSMEYSKPLSQGTFIAKITGKRNYTAKFVNLSN